MQGKSIAGKTAYAAMLIALSMLLSYVEALIPISVGLPGVKPGLANLVVLTGLYYMKPGEVLLISVTRILLSAFLFGGLSALIYSLAGGLLSFGVMLLLKHIKGFSVTGVSIAGAVSHNLGQLAVAVAVVENAKVLYYMPGLMIAGVAAGAVMGILAQTCRRYLTSAAGK
ncbi:MAG: Gx transporter family protein [Acetatifactor sp.]